jgi:hypothetical protein
MEDWVEKYNEIARKFNEFGKTFGNTGFKSIEQAAETFALMCIKLCREDASSISLLLKEGLYCEAMVILRNSLELLFKIHWVHNGDTHEEQNDRIYRLEGKTLTDFQKEVNYMLEKATEENSKDLKEIAEKHQKEIDRIKDQSPYLLNERNNFKASPTNIAMAGDLVRQKFYHNYRYLCMYAHSSPLLSDMLLSEDYGEKMFRESIEQVLDQCVAVYWFIMGFCSNILSEHVPETHDVRERLYNEMKELAK